MALKDAYYSLEDKYYKAVDKLGLSKIAGSIDKVFPSFILLLIIIVIVAAAAGLFFLNVPIFGEYAIVASFEDKDTGEVLANLPVSYTYNGITEDGTTDEFGELSIQVPANAVVVFDVDVADYEPFSGNITADSPGKKENFSLTPKVFPPETRRVVFAAPNGTKLDGTEINVQFLCSNSGVYPVPTHASVTSGETTVSVPYDCGQLTSQISVSGYRDGSYLIGVGGVINLDALTDDETSGSVIIKTIDEQTMQPLDGIEIILYTEEGIEQNRKYTVWGEAVLSAAPGSYYAVATDHTLNYASGRVDLVISSTRRTEIIELSKSIKGYIEVSVVDKASGAGIASTGVKLLDAAEKVVSAADTNSGAGKVKFAIENRLIYYVSVMHDDYLSPDDKKVDATDIASGALISVEMEMERINSENSGQVLVKVRDEDLLPVQNSQVALFNAETGFLAPYGTKTTDVNGVAKFKGVKDGSYYAVSMKYPARGQSDATDVRVREINNITVDMFVGRGILKVKVVDSDDRAVPFASVEFSTLTIEDLGTLLTEADGTAEMDFKADKKVYVIVRKAGYTTWVSAAKQIFPNETMEINAELQEEILGEIPRVVFLGVFKDGSEVEKLEAGQLYTAKLQLLMPTDREYDEAGIHFRVGQEALVEKEKIYVNYVNAPLAAVVKGSTYNPPKGIDIDSDNITNADALWTDIKWHSGILEAGIYNIEIEVKIRQETTAGYILPLHYRAWAVDSSGRYLRDPLDEELGYGEETASKKALYASANMKTYYEGASAGCTDGFCYSERVFDPAEGLYVSGAPYNVKIFQDYNLQFSITNDSPALYNNSSIRIKNSADGTVLLNNLKIGNYWVRNADSKKFSGNNAGYEIEDPISLGYFAQSKNIEGMLTVQGMKIENSSMLLQVEADGRIVFEKAVGFSIVNKGNLAVSVSPEVLGAYVANGIEIEAKYGADTSESGRPVEDALVRLTIIAPDNSKSTKIGRTDQAGKESFLIPASEPETKVIIEVEKAGYASVKIEKEITQEIIEFMPEELVFDLDATENRSTRKELVAENLIEDTVAIKDMYFSSEFQGLLDKEAMENALAAYFESELVFEEPLIINVDAKLSANVKSLADSKRLESKLVIEVENPYGVHNWVFDVPVEINISPGTGASETTCLIVETTSDWTQTLTQTESVFEFTLTNNCMSASNTPLELQNLKARLEWTGEEGAVGNVHLAITRPESPDPVENVLKNNFWLIFLDEMEHIDTPAIYPSAATFVAKEGSQGKNADFRIVFEAELMTNSGIQKIQGNQPIEASFLVTNIKECVIFNLDDKRLAADDDSALLTIDATNCGDLKIDYRICHWRDGTFDKCRNGTEEGGIRVDPNEYISTTAEQPIAEIDIRRFSEHGRQVAGIYGMEIEARPFGGHPFTLIAIEDIIIEPSIGQFFSMNMYEFNLFPEDRGEGTEFINRMMDEEVEVTAKVKHWQDAAWSSNDTALYVFSGIAMGAIAGAAAGAAAGPEGVAIGAAVGALVGGITGYFLAMQEKEKLEETITDYLNEFVINLAGNEERDPDARDSSGSECGSQMDMEEYEEIKDDCEVDVSIEGINAYWDISAQAIDGQRYNGENGEHDLHMIEAVGIVFYNKEGIEEPLPIYGIVETAATDHVHGDISHSGSANLDCGEGFENYNLDGQCSGIEKKEYKQKFHIKVKTTIEKEELPDVGFDEAACQSETGQRGLTGEYDGVLPRTRFNWNWTLPSMHGSQRQIEYNSCDFGNDEYIYCDAVQFNIELVKRLEILKEFLEANGGSFSCPPQPDSEESMERFNEEYSAHEPFNEVVGLSRIWTETESTSVTVRTNIENKTGDAQDVTVMISVTGEEYDDSCTTNVEDLAADSSAEAMCEFTDLPEGMHIAYAEITDSSGTFDDTKVSTAFNIVEESDDSGECEVGKSTEIVLGIPLIDAFILATPDVKWTEDVPDMGALDNLLHFNSFLMRDGYTNDLKQDFAKYYTESAFSDAPSYFIGDGQTPGFVKYYQADEALEFSRKYLGRSTMLPAPGLYNVALEIRFIGELWEFFDSTGNLNAKIDVVFQRLESEDHGSPFYYLPLDGFVGMEGDVFERQGYGVTFENQDFGTEINVTSDIPQLKTLEGVASNPAVEATTEVQQSFFAVNTNPSTRGMLLKVESFEPGEARIVFSPSRATPVMMNYTVQYPRDTEFGAFYSVAENNVEVDTGNTLTYWGGAGVCLDYTGVPVFDVFDSTPDRAAKPSDGFSSWEKAYGIDWTNAEYAGDVYLRTIFYSSTLDNSSYLLSAKHPRGLSDRSVEFETTKPVGHQGSGEIIDLMGIDGMTYNSPTNPITSLQDVFEMVKDGRACAANNGYVTTFFWNPQNVYKYPDALDPPEGDGISIHTKTVELDAGTDCIDYGGQEDYQ